MYKLSLFQGNQSFIPRQFIRKIIEKAIDVDYHHRHRKEALAILKSLERNLGKLSKKEKLACDKYAEAVLGSRKYAPWLYVYTKNQGEFKTGWIPDNYYGKIVVRNITSDYAEITSFKSLQLYILKSDLLNDILARINGQWFTPDLVWIDPASVKEILFKTSSQVVFKEDNSLQGLGVHIYDSKTFNIDAISQLGNGVFQGYIHQHDTLSRFDPGSVATLRLTTSSHMGVVKVRGAYLRLGRRGDSHIKSASALKVPIDTLTGRLSPEGFSPKLERFLQHPDSKVEFSGIRVPAFDEVLTYVQALHSQVPFIGCIGWDLAIDHESKVWLLEWNGGHNDIKFIEATQGPMFVDLKWESLSRNV